MADKGNRFFQHFLIQAFFIEHNIRFDHAAAFAVRNPCAFQNCILIVKPPALHAIIAERTSVQLQYCFAAGSLMQSIDILRDDRF